VAASPTRIGELEPLAIRVSGARAIKAFEAVLLYLQRTPAAPLNHSIRMLWYARAGEVGHRRERILPTGCTQIIFNLARDFLLDCPVGQDDRRMAPALIVGARSVYEIVDSSDMADLIGVVFAPAGFARFTAEAAHLFSNQSVALYDVWGSRSHALRDRLRELHTPQARLDVLEQFLCGEFMQKRAHGRPARSAEIDFALCHFECNPVAASVRDTAHRIGWSERRFSQVFREEVGLAPKVWCRVQRFQRAVRVLHAGGDIRWAELALDCGYYDQSHFANEFRAFAGVDATTYFARRTLWSNHIIADR
jgi:AraC-like DNA-binding protein